LLPSVGRLIICRGILIEAQIFREQNYNLRSLEGAVLERPGDIADCIFKSSSLGPHRVQDFVRRVDK
jgi:hypothetical protein